MPLLDYIIMEHGGNQSEFAREIGVTRGRVGQMISEGWIVLPRKDGRKKPKDWLYAPKREL